VNKENNGKVNLPKRNKLVESINVVQNFKSMCKHQLELGYWVTMDFPTKHHLNRILSIQYTDIKTVERIYGSGLAKAALKLVPSCKHYILFLKEDNDRMENREN
jgi:hypothetical protein